MPPDILKHLLFSAMTAALIVAVTVLAICAIFFYLKTRILGYAKSRLQRLTSGKRGKLIEFLRAIIGNYGTQESASDFYAVPPLSGMEQNLYRRLVEAMPDHIVLAQVAFSQFLKNDDWGENNTMKQKVADFMICGPSFNIISLIELDDSSHNHKVQEDRDRDANVAQAGLKTVRWHVSRFPDRAEIRWKSLGLKEEGAGQEASRWAPR